MGSKARSVWTREREDIFWDGVEKGVRNKDIARLAGVTHKQVCNKRMNECGAYGPSFYKECAWTKEELIEANDRFLAALRLHHPSEIDNGHSNSTVRSFSVRATQYSRTISGVPLRSSRPV